METILLLLGWVVYILVALVAFCIMPYRFLKHAKRKQIGRDEALVWLFFVACTLLFGLTDISKLHLLWVVPIGYVLIALFLGTGSQIAKLESAGNVKELIRFLHYEGSSRARQEAATALGKLRNRQVIQPLIAALQDQDAKVRGYAAWALGMIGDGRAVEPLIALCQDPTEEALPDVDLALFAIGIPAIEPLMTAFKSKDMTIRRASCGALMKYSSVNELMSGGLNLDHVIEVSKDSDVGLHESDFAEIRKLLSERHLDAFIAALQDPDIQVRSTASFTLGWLLDPRTVEPLIASLQDSEVDVRRNAVHALGEIGDARAVEPLIAALKDKDDRVCGLAACALGKLGDHRAVEPLITMSNNYDSFYCGDALLAVSKIGGARAVDRLVIALEQPRKYASLSGVELVNDWIVQWLDAANWQPGLDEYAARYWITKGELEKCVEIGQPAIRPLIEVLGKDKAVQALIKIGEPAVQPLSQVVEHNYENWQAIRALEGIGGPSAAKAVAYARDLAHSDKSCSNCNRKVPSRAKAGDTCPHCGAHWSSEVKVTR